MDDRFYIEKILSGDINSFEYFVNTYTKYAFSLSFTIVKDKWLAEDVVQESFIKAFNGLKTYKGNSRFQTWLGRIVINESLRVVNQRANEKKVMEDISNCEIEALNISIDSLMAHEQRFHISSVFEKIPPNESIALELYYLKDNSIVEIKELTGWSASKIKMLLLRGRKSFYNHLKILLKSEIKILV